MTDLRVPLVGVLRWLLVTKDQDASDRLLNLSWFQSDLVSRKWSELAQNVEAPSAPSTWTKFAQI